MTRCRTGQILNSQHSTRRQVDKNANSQHSYFQSVEFTYIRIGHPRRITVLLPEPVPMPSSLSSLFTLTLLAGMTTAAVPAAAQGNPIKIGAILPLTGSGASYGVWMKGGAEMAAEEINAAGGIAGRKLEVIYEDHAADASKAVNAMRRLVEVEKVPFSLTSYSSPTLAVQPIAAQNKVVIMNGGGQSDSLADKDYLYNNIPVVSNEVGVIE